VRTVFTGEGCLTDASRLLADLDETWSDKELDERSDISDITDDAMANYDDGDPGDGAGKTDWFEHRRNLVSAEHPDGWTKLRAPRCGLMRQPGGAGTGPMQHLIATGAPNSDKMPV